jgi:two-component system, cell cycle sensor histidine kinase and response regulator CckA
VERLESLGRLVGGVAHDFNNLLSVIVGHADLSLSELPEGSPSRDDLVLVRQLAERGAAFTRQLLVFSRQEPLEPETLNVNEVVVHTEKVLGGAIDADVEFVTELDPDLWPVRIDRSELERLLLNLVANARRAMPEGGTLTIRTRNAGPAATAPADAAAGVAGAGVAGVAGVDGSVRLCVIDTGVGMTPEVAQHAFEPYFTTDSDAGTGLGLSAAYGVVTAAGGTIGLTSVPGVGTTVRIDLPAVGEDASAPPDPEPPPPLGGGQRILVVEDDQDVRSVVTLMLSRAGYEVVTAPSPTDALAVLERATAPIDMLLTDIVMPGASGIVLAEEVRDRYSGLPVLLMSGYTSGALPGDPPLPDGMSLIRKPFTTASLLRAVAAAQRRVG